MYCLCTDRLQEHLIGRHCCKSIIRPTKSKHIFLQIGYTIINVFAYHYVWLMQCFMRDIEYNQSFPTEMIVAFSIYVYYYLCHVSCHRQIKLAAFCMMPIFHFISYHYPLLCLRRHDYTILESSIGFTKGYCIHWPSHCPACRTTLIATRFWVVMICPIIKCLTVLEFSFILLDLCLFITIFQFYFKLCTYCNILDIYLS